MAGLPIYFEQRLVGTIDVDKSGAGFTYAPDWIGLTGAFPISTTMPLINVGAHPFRHFPTLVGKSAARKRAASNSRTASRNGAERCNRSAIRDRRRHRWRTLDRSTGENFFGPMAASGQAGRS